MSLTERLRSPTRISKVSDLEFYELLLKVEVILPGGRCLTTSRVLTKQMATDLLPPDPNIHEYHHHILQREQKRTKYLRRQEIIRFYSDEIASQLTQALETNDNIDAALSKSKT